MSTICSASDAVKTFVEGVIRDVMTGRYIYTILGINTPHRHVLRLQHMLLQSAPLYLGIDTALQYAEPSKRGSSLPQR